MKKAVGYSIGASLKIIEDLICVVFCVEYLTVMNLSVGYPTKFGNVSQVFHIRFLYQSFITRHYLLLWTHSFCVWRKVCCYVCNVSFFIVMVKLSGTWVWEWYSQYRKALDVQEFTAVVPIEREVFNFMFKCQVVKSRKEIFYCPTRLSGLQYVLKGTWCTSIHIYWPCILKWLFSNWFLGNVKQKCNLNLTYMC